MTACSLCAVFNMTPKEYKFVAYGLDVSLQSAEYALMEQYGERMTKEEASIYVHSFPTFQSPGAPNPIQYHRQISILYTEGPKCIYEDLVFSSQAPVDGETAKCMYVSRKRFTGVSYQQPEKMLVIQDAKHVYLIYGNDNQGHCINRDLIEQKCSHYHN